MKALRRRHGHALGRGLVHAARDHSLVTAAVVGTLGGLAAGAAGAIPGVVVGATTGIAVVRLIKG